jgi:uncharacterized membrane protein
MNDIKSEDKIWGAFGYLWILSLVVLAARKDNEFVRFHANQGVLLFLCSLVVILTGPFMMLFNLIIGIVAIIGIIKAITGEKWALPIGADWAKSLGDWVVKTLKF